MLFLRAQPPVFVQLHSQDYFVRVADRTLRKIAFDHICTVQDPTALQEDAIHPNEAKRTGYTEWQAIWHGRALSLGWDWVTRDDGRIQRINTVPPRSNLRLVDAHGYDLRPDAELPDVCALIDSLAWQSIALQAIEDSTCLHSMASDWSRTPQ